VEEVGRSMRLLAAKAIDEEGPPAAARQAQRPRERPSQDFILPLLGYRRERLLRDKEPSNERSDGLL
jgi:hypothetical protein